MEMKREAGRRASMVVFDRVSIAVGMYMGSLCALTL